MDYEVETRDNRYMATGNNYHLGPANKARINFSNHAQN
jgi:hypothetical protein